MRIISYNVNGIRSAMNKGFIEWLKAYPADVVCLQETKAWKENVTTGFLMSWAFTITGTPHRKKDTVALQSLRKLNPQIFNMAQGHKISDDEGRVLQLDFGDVRLINAYFPSGTTGETRQAFKYGWLDEFFIYLETLKKSIPKIILCGDYNIAHKEIDIHNPKGNVKTSGFLPGERAWMDKFFMNGWVDAFRVLHPEPHRYSWWSQRFPTVRLQNKGWLIDYINVTEPLKNNLKDAEILPDVQHSDHCPVFLEIDI